MHKPVLAVFGCGGVRTDMSKNGRLYLRSPGLKPGFSDCVKLYKVSKALGNLGKTDIHSLSQWVQLPLPEIKKPDA